MNGILLAGAGLAFAIGLAHSVLGERYILIRLFRRTDLPHLFGSDLFTRRTLRFAWHLTTIAWWGLGSVLLLLGRHDADASLVRDTGTVIALTCLLSSVVLGAGSRGRHLAWTALLVIALAAWFGTR